MGRHKIGEPWTITLSGEQVEWLLTMYPGLRVADAVRAAIQEGMGYAEQSRATLQNFIFPLPIANDGMRKRTGKNSKR